MKKKVIILTGGGSAGHVVPNMALFPDLVADGWEVHYIGSRSGIEANIAPRDGMAYHAIASGKLRRYFDIKNFFDPFCVLAGIVQSLFIIAKLKPAVIFSKGGFVAAPAVIGGWLSGVPVVIHESDSSQGLANRICAPFSTKICFSYKQSIAALQGKTLRKAVYTGTPVRPELSSGDAAEGYRLCGFSGKKPVLLAIGGSQGSQSLNRIVRTELPALLKDWQVAHICGRGNVDMSLAGMGGYAQFEYLGDELAHIYKIARAAVSRAGSNVLFELLYLKIPALLIPLPLTSSRGDQIMNAAAFERSGYSVKLDEHDAEPPGALCDALKKLESMRDKLIKSMQDAEILDSKKLLLKTIYDAALPCDN